MNRRIFETYVETQLAPTLQPGDIVILDNLPAHKSAAAEATIRARALGSYFCRPIAPTSIQSRWVSPSSRPCCAPARSGPSTPPGAQSAKICDLFTPAECRNYFGAAGSAIAARAVSGRVESCGVPNALEM